MAPIEQVAPKAVSLDNLQTFKEKCDETYAKKTEIPEEYTLPVANASTLGGVKPVAKTSEMTQNVGVDSDGALYTKPAPPVDSTPTNGSDNPVSSGGVYTALTPLQHDMEQAQTDIGNLQDDVTALQNAVNASYYTTQDITAAYTARTTAAGAQIVDRGLAMLKTVQGKTVSSENLLNVSKTTFGSNNRVTYDPETYTFSLNAGNTSFSENIYHFPIPLPAGTEVSTYIEFDQGYFTGTASVGGYHRDTPNTWQGEVAFPAGQDLTGRTISSSFTATDTITDFWLFIYSDVQVTTPVRFRIVFKLGGTTQEFIPYFSGLKNAYFQSLKSTGANSETDEISLAAAEEIPEYNSIDFENGQNITGGKTLVFNGTETWTQANGGFSYTLPETGVASTAIVGLPYLAGTGELSSLQDGYANNDATTLLVKDSTCATVAEFQQKLASLSSAGTPLEVRYQLASPTSTSLDVSPYYRAFNGGTETVEPGSTDNSDYGAVSTLTQNYVEKGGIDL